MGVTVITCDFASHYSPHSGHKQIPTDKDGRSVFNYLNGPMTLIYWKMIICCS